MFDMAFKANIQLAEFWAFLRYKNKGITKNLWWLTYLERKAFAYSLTL